MVPCAPDGEYFPLPVYGLEEDSDIVFYTANQWRLPANSHVLKESNNVVFRSMFSNNFSFPTEKGTSFLRIDVEDVQGKALDNLLRCLYKESFTINSVDAGLSTLYAGHKYQCPELVKHCVSYLTDHLDSSNVLSVIRFAKLLGGNYQNLQNVMKEEDTKCSKVSLGSGRRRSIGLEEPLPLASAPFLPDDLDEIELECSSLLRRCLKLVDEEATVILESDELEELDLETLTLILSRDTLDVDDEIKVFEALLRWAEQQCKQHQLPLTILNKRGVLQDSLFLPRYLTMTLGSWESGPLASGLFAKEEVIIIESLIRGKVSLSQVESPHAPLFKTSTLKRTPVRPEEVGPRNDKDGPSKNKESLLSRFLHFLRWDRVGCCKKGKMSTASKEPILIGNRSQESSGRERMNLLEQCIVCFACMFD